MQQLLKHHLIDQIYITKYVPKPKILKSDIIRFIKQNKGKSGIIYCLSRKKVEEIAKFYK